MQIVTELSDLRERLAPHVRAGRTIGFVPTMGSLHDGHLSLVRLSRGACDVTVVSVFVNPMQFGDAGEVAAYPANLDHDIALCRAQDIAILFIPNIAAIYPKGFETAVEPGALAQPLCGAFRPGHFRGVATIVAKLLNMVQPHKAFFGQKDFQQYLVVRRMVADLNMLVEIVASPTVREVDGLAMSSRNAALTTADRQRARCISEGLFAAEDACLQGETNVRKLVSLVKARLKPLDSVDYVELRDARTLLEFDDHIERDAVLAVAGHIGKTRLIDNVLLRV